MSSMDWQHMDICCAILCWPRLAGFENQMDLPSKRGLAFRMQLLLLRFILSRFMKKILYLLQHPNTFFQVNVNKRIQKHKQSLSAAKHTQIYSSHFKSTRNIRFRGVWLPLLSACDMQKSKNESTNGERNSILHFFHGFEGKKDAVEVFFRPFSWRFSCIIRNLKKEKQTDGHPSGF